MNTLAPALYSNEPEIGLQFNNQLPHLQCLTDLNAAIPTVNDLQKAISELLNKNTNSSDGFLLKC